VPKGAIRLRRALDMRYRGQGYEIEVPLPDGVDPAEAFKSLHALFDASYEQIFSLSYVDAPIEIVNWKVEALGPDPEFGAKLKLGIDGVAGKKLKGKRKAYFPEQGDYADVPVYDRYALEPSDEVVGPAFVEEREATFVVGVGDRVRVDEIGNLVAEIAAGGGL
jgi:N-methylhydantoinase A/oxoprolinase/acetone carboxylase beta subunit